MVEQVRVQELTPRGEKQDCGCGCGGNLCGAARSDCGCGCGDSQCRTIQQELVWVNSAQVEEMKQQATGNVCACDGSCGCWSE